MLSTYSTLNVLGLFLHQITGKQVHILDWCLDYGIYFPNWSPACSLVTSNLPSMMDDLCRIHISSFPSTKTQKCLSLLVYDFMTGISFSKPLFSSWGNNWNSLKENNQLLLLAPYLHKLLPLTREFLVKSSESSESVPSLFILLATHS